MKKLLHVLCTFMFIVICTTSWGQSRTISGTVVDAKTGAPLPGATIIIKGTSNGSYALENGNFSIPNISGTVILETSFVGYTPNELEVPGSQTEVNIKMEPSIKMIEEVVVVAFGQADRKSLTGAVSTISSDAIAERPITDVTSALNGTSSGIQMTSSGGAPGSAPTIRIRGTGSINASSDPLYVVDGIPFTGRINSIDPEDIASMSVLKDAASAALYGSRAANGVVLITTKKGRANKVSFNVKVSQGLIVKAQPEYETLDAVEFYETSWERYRNNLHFSSGMNLEDANQKANDNVINMLAYNIMRDKNTGTQIPNNQLVSGVAFSGDNGANGWQYGQINPNAEIMPGYADEDTWINELMETGYRQKYNFSATGGTDKATFYASLGYMNEDGYVMSTSIENINARLSGDFKMTKWLDAGVNLYVNSSTVKNPFTTGNGYWANPWYLSRFAPAIYPVYLHDQYTGEYILDPSGNKMYDLGNGYSDDEHSQVKRPYVPRYNSVHQAQNDINVSKRLSTSGQVYANAKIYDGLVLNLEYNTTNYTNRYRWVRNPEGGDGAPMGKAESSTANNFEWNFKQILKYDKQFGDHKIGALLGHEAYSNLYEYSYINKQGQVIDGITELDNYSEVIGDSGYSSQYSTEGYLAGINYGYKNRYFFDASYRRDGNSKFHPSRQWGNFWSVSGSWIVSDESFMSNAMWVDFLKLRASYGVLGNDGGVGNYVSQGLYLLDELDGSAVVRWSTDGSPDLTWETSKSLDISLDFRLWNRLNGSFEFFNRTSSDLIFSVPQAVSSGQSTVDQNIGAMYNRGIEFSFDVDVIRKKDWTWNIGLNATWYKNKVTELAPEIKDVGVINDSKKIMEGHGIYDYWVRQTNGVDPQDGMRLFYLDENITPYDQNNKNHSMIDGVAYTKLRTQALFDYEGSAIPDLYGGITTSLTWKNLTLNLLFTYKIGGKAMDNTYSRLTVGSDFYTNRHVDILTDAWRQPGDVATLPRFQSSNTNIYVDYVDTNLVDASYIALQNITLNYNFNKKVTNKLKIDGLSVYASGENLFQVSAIKGFDATYSFTGVQSSSRFPSAATITFGVNVSF